MASFLVPSSHEMFVKETHRFFAGAIVESVAGLIAGSKNNELPYTVMTWHLTLATFEVAVFG